MAIYDPAVIQQYADSLYTRAVFVVLSFAAAGGVLGIGFGVATAGRGGPGVGTLLLGGVGAALGVAFGSGRAFLLRLQAQQILCQVQLEANTAAAVRAFSKLVEANERAAAEYAKSAARG